MTSRIIFILLMMTTFVTFSETYKILVVVPMPMSSHAILGHALVRHLSKAGHEITHITAMPHEKPMPGVKEVDVSSIAQVLPKQNFDLNAILGGGWTPNYYNATENKKFMSMEEMQEYALGHPSVQELLRDQNQSFDVIIAEWGASNLYIGLSAIFKCPFIWLSTTDPYWKSLQLIDGIPNPTYTPDFQTDNVPPFNFCHRLFEFMSMFTQVLFDTYAMYVSESFIYSRSLVPIIQERGNIVPSFIDLRYNASLMLGNSHESFGKIISFPPNYVSIGGYHIDSNLEPLPESLKEIMDNATDGVIYFSMGSALRSEMMPDKLKQDLLEMFGILNQTVLWKLDENLQEKPKNVYTMKWAQQQSILNHSNCILFISHAGLLSTIESIHFAKPMIGIPVYGDQFSNIARSVEKGIAVKVELSHKMAKDIKNAICMILTDPRFKEKVKELSFLYHNRAIEPGKNLVHWVEFVAKTGGARHLRSTALDLFLFQKLFIDVIIFLIFAIFVPRILIFFIKFSLCTIQRKKQKLR